jgi:phospholipase C
MPPGPVSSVEAEWRGRVDHIVIVMMENRSFDHMLGYLSMTPGQLGDPDVPESMVDGLPDDGFAVEWDGTPYSTYPLGTTTLPAKYADPDHSGTSVAWQVTDTAQYVASFAEKLARLQAPQPDPGLVMGYLTGKEVPVYDFLAREFCVCDRWFCSVPGETWPNRMFAVAGTSGGETDIPATALEGALGDVETVFRHLDERDVSWRWYSSDPSLLRAFDRHYRFDDGTHRFAYFNQRTERQPTSFLSDVAAGTLPSVAWVDPNFFRIPLIDTPEAAEDDHPPHDVMLGQRFIHLVYEALRKSQCWEKTLLIVTYDEHGGFFDHVTPPAPLGPRVPALAVSSWVARGVPCHIELEHTAIIKTILRRFGNERAMRAMGPRVYYANDVWAMLTATKPRPWPEITDPGEAALSEGDLEVKWLEWPGSTLKRTLEVLDENHEQLVQLQRDLLQIYAHLRSILPLPIARVLSWLGRRLRLPTKPSRVVVETARRRLPERVRPIPDRQP